MYLQPVMAVCEIRKQGGDLPAAEIGGSANPKTAACGAAPGSNLGFKISQLLQDAAAVFQIDRAFVRQPKAPRATVRQLDA